MSDDFTEGRPDKEEIFAAKVRADNELSRLIADLEAATEGSRKLSDRVLLACGWAIDGECWVDPEKTEWSYWAPEDLPDPTRNTHDALALVPEGWGWSVAFINHPDHALMGGATGFAASIWNKTLESKVWTKSNATAPLAVCIAILKAQEQDR